MKRIPVMLVDDHPLIRLGIRQLLATAQDIAVVGEAESGVEALRLLDALAAEVIVLDLAMGGRSGVEILQRIVAHDPAPPVLVYSRFPEEQYAVRCVRAGAAEYLMKSAAPDELLKAIRQLAGGKRYLSASAAALLEESRETRGATLHELLSEREFEVFRLIVSGLSVSQIAGELCLSIKTISTHRTRILQKLHLNSTADLVRLALRHGVDEESA